MDWLKVCGHLEIKPPHPMAAEIDPNVSDVKEIISHFKSQDEKMWYENFLKHYSQLSTKPSRGESKLQQMIKSIRLMKIAKQNLKELKQMGIKLK